MERLLYKTILILKDDTQKSVSIVECDTHNDICYIVKTDNTSMIYSDYDEAFTSAMMQITKIQESHKADVNIFDYENKRHIISNDDGTTETKL